MEAVQLKQVNVTFDVQDIRDFEREVNALFLKVSKDTLKAEEIQTISALKDLMIKTYKE